MAPNVSVYTNLSNGIMPVGIPLVKLGELMNLVVAEFQEKADFRRI